MKPWSKLFPAAVLAAWFAMPAMPAVAAPREADAKPVLAERRFSVRGMGLRSNLRLRRTVQILADDDRGNAYHSAVFIEDTVLILLDHMAGQGYLHPRVKVRATAVDGTVEVFEWTGAFLPKVSRTSMFRHVRFRMIPGRRFYYRQLGIAGLRDFQGVELLTPEEAESYFFADGFLNRSSHRRIFTPARFRKGMNNLQETLRHLGYRDAVVTGSVVDMDRTRGSVRAAVNVEAGPRYLVRRLVTRLLEAGGGDPALDAEESVMLPWSRFWEQDTLLRVRNAFYGKGHADVQCVLAVEDIEESPGERLADLAVSVRAGPVLQAGAVRFEGRRHTREKSMRHRLSIREGDPLNPLAVEQSRQRLASMGSFDRVLVEYHEAGGNARDVVFMVEEGRRLEISLLAGYGSYELLRGGLDVEQFNLWGRGHRSRASLVQSFKSTSADYLYSIPELLGERLSGFSSVSALQRHEIDFLRREAGVETGIRRYLPDWAADASFRYSYTFLQSRRFDGAGEVGIPDAEVGALSTDIRRDRRDNPVFPARGGHVSSRVELASKALGGNAEYVMWEAGGSLHRPIGGGRIWHGGLHHGVVKALGDEVEKLPFNKRFFPGGDRSLRGYRYGQAASLNEEDQLIGSEFFGLLQNEIEQALTPAFSLVVFTDLLQIGSTLAEYPQGDLLISVGAGLRYQTIVGPLRLEYGHNVRRRDADPHGTFHFSVGFPF